MKYLPFILAGGVFLFVPCAFLYSFFREQRFSGMCTTLNNIWNLECFGRYRRGVGIAEVDILNTMITAMASTTLFL